MAENGLTARDLDVHWDRLRASTWVAFFNRCWRPSLLQSPAYGMARAQFDGTRARLGVVRAGHTTLAAVMVLERQALNRKLQALTLHRGPAWVQEDLEPATQEAVLAALRQSWPRRLGRRMGVIPELPASPENRQLVRRAGFRPTRKPGYRTVFWDLQQDPETRWARLHQGWRNALRQARRRKITVEAERDATHLTPLIEAYQQDKERRRYPGPRPEFAQQLGLTATETGDLLLVRGLYRGQTEAAGLFIRHGRAATYVIGWTTAEGRWRRANHAVLWHAAEELARDGVAWLDLGGLNGRTGSGVDFFKRSLGGEEIVLVGTYT